jgi:protoporphyrin/coproporphyrin ferrochelatase
VQQNTSLREYTMAFAKEPPYTHGSAGSLNSRTAILLCNLGTPDAPTAIAVRRYLAEFLSDHRVVEIPKAIWWLILHGIILRLRPVKSAAKYASIWTAEGSPLKVWSEKQAKLLQGFLGEQGHKVQVRLGMRYANPSMRSQLDALKAQGFTRILVLPMYPQYSGTTTASVFDAVYSWGSQVRRIPELRFVNNYHDHAGYIDALVARINGYWKTHGTPDKLVMSFHGVPERTLHLGDTYHCECYKTARLVSEKLGLTKDQLQVTFQSRFGKAKWLEPYTEPTLIALAQSGIKRVDVVCPGFTVDCLETLEEIAMEAKEAFVHAGQGAEGATDGRSFHYIPCLNDSPEWVRGLGHIAAQHLSGWETRVDLNSAELALQSAHAKALGATH